MMLLNNVIWDMLIISNFYSTHNFRIIENLSAVFQEKLDRTLGHIRKGIWLEYDRSFNKKYLLDSNFIKILTI